MNIHLTDPDNRDHCGASFEFKGPSERVIKYLDGPLRRDTLEGSHFYVDAAIAALLAGGIDEAAGMARQVGVYLTEITGELPEVIEMGESGDEWLVTGTTDAHSAETAVRQHLQTIYLAEDYEDLYGDLKLGELVLEYRADWAWKRPADRTLDEPLDEADKLVSGTEGDGWPRFAGYLVQQ